MKDDGFLAESIQNLFKLSVNKYMPNANLRPFSFEHFTSATGKQLDLF